MNDQAQDDQDLPAEEPGLPPPDQPPQEPEAAPASPPPQSLPEDVIRKQRLQMAAGFLGWFLVNILVWLLITGGVGALNTEYRFFANLFIFPVNVVALIALLVIKKTRRIGWGILAALGINILLSLLLGLVFNAACFIPFMFPFQ